MKQAREALSDKKAVDIVILDVRGLSSVTDYYLIATANNSPHLKALTTALEDALDNAGGKRHRKSGKPESGWIVDDYVDIVAHLFTDETRKYYALEELWNDAKRVE